EQMRGVYDLVFLMTKQIDNANVARNLVNFLAEDGVICTFQNGLPEYLISGIVGEKRTYGCTVAWGATLLGDGVCKLTSDPDNLSFGLGSFGNTDNDTINQIKSVLEHMGKVKIETNFIGARWSKLLTNSSFSAMSAILGCTVGEVAGNRESRLYVQRLIKECIDVTKAADIQMEPIQGKDPVKLFDYDNIIKEKISNFIIPIAIRKHRLSRPSLLQDLEKGKKTEIDSINGVVCEFGRKHGVPTPYNDLVVSIIHEIEQGEYKPGFENLRLFKEAVN
ncbi:MAG TPA: ketopantoate reductase C-terminal domain-containing protein, partial [Anaerolineales bacterium]|nr:ketopantoate reductase C-terminal domain-containing protein [Anaerolineales bacterium]